jgi:hypothetical protein
MSSAENSRSSGVPVDPQWNPEAIGALTKLLKEITSCSFSRHLRHDNHVFTAQAFDPLSRSPEQQMGESARFSSG